MGRQVQISALIMLITALLAIILATTTTVMAMPNAQATTTSTITATGTLTPTGTVTATDTPIATTDATATNVATGTATEAPNTTATIAATGTATASTTETATGAATGTATASTTETATGAATETMTAPTGTMTAVATETATGAATGTATMTATETATAVATATATAVATGTATVAATGTPGTIPSPTASLNAAQEYCETQGGAVTTRRPTYNTNAPQSEWLPFANPREFCTFLAAPDSTGFQSQIEIALDTLYADEPTLAVLAYLEPVALPPFTGANPSTLYCSKLGGTDVWGGQDTAAGGGWVTDAPDSATNLQVVSMCVFPDMSAIDSWGLAYKANGVVRGQDLTDVVRYKPDVLPNVFVNSSSPHQPAEDTVDTTLSESDTGSNVTLGVGDILKVQLPSNPSTGFSWVITTDDDTIVAAVGEPQFDLGTGTPVPGAGGTQTFTFKAMAPGTTTLTLVYSRPWETDVTPTPENTWTVNVTVE